jgi:hypothetical protein
MNDIWGLNNLWRQLKLSLEIAKCPEGGDYPHMLVTGLGYCEGL